MKLNFSLLSLFLLSFLTYPGFAEGTKELMPNESNPTRMLLDPGSGRVPFALYSSRANADYRLYIHIANPATERIYFGLGQQRNSGNATIESKINWRIHPPDLPDVDECSGQTPIKNTLPTLPDVGYISTYLEAYNGPNNIDPAGYNPLVCAPTHGPGDYFITFQATSTRTFDFFDIAVVNIASTPPSIIPGRVFSKCWQIRNPSNGPNWYTFEGDMFIYSNDGIVTKLDPNGMEGRDFAVSCNESGCYPIAPPYNAQQARQSRPGPSPHNYPQFKIFVNNPDQVEYPDGIIGQLVDGSVTTQSSCTTGTVDFTFLTTPVNAIGTVEIILSLSALTPPLVDRILITNNVPGGNYTVTWDGLDGAGTQVPSGSTFPFTLRYTNGLTHMPLWDVEKNVNGFIVNLVRPVQIPPLDDPAFYWDDILVGGSQMLISPGCTTPPATSCHAWTSDWGDQKTINTWWYLVSNSTQNVNVTYKRGPDVLVASAPPQPASVCPGGTMTFTVNPDPNSLQYHWAWPGGSQVTTVNTINITFPSNTPAGTTNVSVYGSNTDCGDGQTTLIPITILPVPDLTTSLSQTTCSGVPFSITLNSSPVATNYTWSVAPADCSGNITACPTGNGSGMLLTGNLSVTNLSQGTVNYHITPLSGTCSGEVKVMTITVDPKPNVTSPATFGESLCSGSTANITLQSGLTGPTLTWSWGTQCSNIQACPAGGTSAIISHTLQLASNLSPGSVLYSITPTFGGCPGDAYPYTVSVLQLPDVQLAQFAPVCLNTPAFTLTGGTPAGAGGVYTLGGNPITVFNPATVGAGTFAITYTYTDANGCVSSDQKDIVVQSLITPNLTGDATACVGVAETYVTDPGMVTASYQWSVAPNGTITGPDPETKSITWPTTGTKTITVSYTDPNGCTTIPATKTVTVNPLPSPTVVTGNFNACVQKSYVYTTQPGMANYSWSVSPGNTLTVTGNSATVLWNVVGNQWIEVNYFDANGCTAVIPTRVPVVVNPSPVYSVTGSLSVCAGSTSLYKLQGTETGIWTITPGGTIIPPANNVNSVSVSWPSGTTPSQATITVDYVNTLGCTGATTTLVDIQPLPVSTFTTSTPSPVCQDFTSPSQYTVTPGGPAATYQWQVNPAANAVITNPTANPALITWKLSGSTAQTVTLTLTATNSATNPACTSTSVPISITINPKPNTQLTACFDVVTTTSAKPIILKGGNPQGATGHYYIDQTTGTAVTQFNPVAAGPGAHTIYYGYTNTNGCIAFASLQINVVAPQLLACGSLLTDPRDNKSYKTVQIGSQCWLQENLRYSAPAPYTSTPDRTPQTDNCTFERYCLSTDPLCTLYGGLYQWDELMQYNTDMITTRQGLCPPGWHVPTEAEWTVLINTISAQPNGSGIAGSYLKDMNSTGQFKANPAGIFYLNTSEEFTTLPLKGIFFWTSTYDAVSGRAVARGLNTINPSVSHYDAFKADAFPVRCIKD